jgi:hypothetical protein
MERKNFLTESKERRFHGVNPWISSCFLYSLSFWLSTLGIYLLDLRFREQARSHRSLRCSMEMRSLVGAGLLAKASSKTPQG